MAFLLCEPEAKNLQCVAFSNQILIEQKKTKKTMDIAPKARFQIADLPRLLLCDRPPHLETVQQTN